MVLFLILLALTLIGLLILAVIAGAIGLVFGDLIVFACICYTIWKLVTYFRNKEL